MSKHIFDIADSAKNAYGAHQCTQQDLDAKMNSDVVRVNCEKAAEVFKDWTEDTPDEETVRLKQEAAKYKIKLPVVLPHAHFRDGHRCNASAEESGLMSMDFDHIRDPRAFYEEKIEPHRDELHLMWAFISPTGTGVKTVSAKPQNLTIEQAQAWFASVIGVSEYDHTHDLARCVYLVPSEFNLYYDAEMLFGQSAEVTNGTQPTSAEGATFNSVGHEPYVSNGNQSTSAVGAAQFHTGEQRYENMPPIQGSNIGANGKDRVDTLSYNMSSLRNLKYDGEARFNGILYSDIARAFWQKMYGKQPQEGMRHQALLDWVREAASICEFSAEKLMQITPRLGKDDEELARIIIDTLGWKKKNFRPTMPYTLNKVLKELGVADNSVEQTTDRAIMEMNEYYLSKMPPLPPAMQAILNGCLRKYWLQVIIGMLPAFNSYLEKVMYKYGTGKLRRPAMMSLIVGERASGKSSVTGQLEPLLKPMREESNAVRNTQDEIRDTNNTRADSEQGKSFKEFIKYLNMNITDAELLATQKIATKCGTEVAGVLLPRRQFMFTEEASIVEAMLKNGNLSCAWRVDFDFGEWGKDVHSDSAVSGLVNLSFDFTALCTQGVLKKILDAKNVENGTASRILIALNPSDHFAHQPSFKDVTKKDSRLIKEAIERLQNAEGIIEAKALAKAEEEWTNNLADWCAEHNDINRDSARRRAGVKGSDAAILYALLEKPNCKKIKNLPISDNALQFFEVIAEYDVEVQSSLFANAENEPIQLSFSGERRQTKNKVLYDALPDVFTRDDIVKAKPGVGPSAISNLLKNLTQQNLIEEIDKKKYRKTNKKGGIK